MYGADMNREEGFSLIELLIIVAIVLVVRGRRTPPAEPANLSVAEEARLTELLRDS